MNFENKQTFVSEPADRVAMSLCYDAPDAPRARGDRIRAAIRGTGLTQGDAALAIGVARPTVVQWLAGGEISEDSLERLARLTGKDPAWIRYGVATGATGSVDRYVEGYAEARADAIEQVERVAESLRRMHPTGAVAAPIEREVHRDVHRAGAPVVGVRRATAKRA